MKNKVKRAEFLQAGVIGASAIGTGGLLSLPKFLGYKEHSPWRFFTDEEGLVLEDILEQIIPTDEWLGAKDAGVGNFIDKHLMGINKVHQSTYRKGLVSIGESCKLIYKKSFSEMSFKDQHAFLTMMEKGKLSRKAQKDQPDTVAFWEPNEDRKFFNMLVDHCMQGYYGSPRHGGNKDYVSYRMIDLDYPFIIGQNRYEENS
ncbi:MAG: gluconate 2-dehydrogenase subunit 3 family protein [Planctomycetes bacterium]|nr:gluconate 2-dehydrogenase subunit 3 family protein [Planctomycetota bacterium]